MVQKLRNIKAFTLIELMIVIVIIAILAAIAIPKLLNLRENTKEQKQIEQPINQEEEIKGKAL